MDVDTPSGTNSGAGKKRFEVKKVRPAGALLQPAAEGGGEAGAGPVAGERATSRSPHGAGRPVPHRRCGRGGAVPAGESWRASGPMAEAGGPTWSGGWPISGRGWRGPRGREKGGLRGLPLSGGSAARPPQPLPVRMGLGCSVPSPAGPRFPELLGSLGRRAGAESCLLLLSPGRSGPVARAALCAA